MGMRYTAEQDSKKTKWWKIEVANSKANSVSTTGSFPLGRVFECEIDTESSAGCYDRVYLEASWRGSR